LNEIPAELTDRVEQRPPAFAGLRGRATSWDSGARPEPAPFAYSLGDDVAHPTFGEGVVTGVEPGGIVVIRFSRDQSERKLVADLAPITKRG
jgi:DNA helicase-2/ATP-dependent DNA helicase PcrA